MIKDIRASIDIGSNSVLLLIGDLSNGDLTELSKKSEVTALGRELDLNKVFHPESMEATYKALKEYVEECDSFGIPRDKIIITATEAARVAVNAKDFFDRVTKDLLIHIHTITSDAEAYFSTKGILHNSSFKCEIITIIDIGGASTELIRVNTKKMEVVDTVSLPVGAVRSSQWLKDDLFVQNLQKIFTDFRNQLDKFQTKELYCVAGTMTSLGNMHLNRKDFVEDDVHGLRLDCEDIDGLFKKYSNYGIQEFLDAFPFLQKRSGSIRGGLFLVYHLIHRLLAKELTISTYGLRYGTLLDGRVKKEFIYGNS
jgi:exopolyphosphatase/guanosine-5'-triphosphate,3'-diphosphate pyrophosphatase